MSHQNYFNELYKTIIEKNIEVQVAAHIYRSVAVQNNLRKRKAAAALAVDLFEREQVPRKYWISPLCALRPVHGFYKAIFPVLKNDLPDTEFINYFRMSTSKFEELLTLVFPILSRKFAIRAPIEAGERLCLTLR